ncbi:putative holin [Aggregatibacter actinomycetemcomitans]|uniref:putative holin n=1 Tax=Aggregatibacter actinomycetemcomitans TaxID=714 RepID=UPI001E4D06AC|nr:putative holin [Aggregatibacter actinomycetemcomitans]
MKGFFNALKHGRLLSWVVSALCLFALIGIVSPVQLPVVLYKLALVSIASIIGYHLDRALFPYSSPGSYLRERWNKRESKIAIRPENTPEYPVCDGYLSILSFIGKNISPLIGASINLKKYQAEIKARAEAAAREVDEVVKKNGLTEETADQIRKQILGIV